MANGIRTGDPRGFNEGRSSKFREGSRIRQTPEEGQRTYQPKRCGNNNKDDGNSPKTLNDWSWILPKIYFAVNKIWVCFQFDTASDITLILRSSGND